MSYNITNTSTGETTSFDGRGVSFVSDDFSASAAAQTKTVHLTTMANQYLDSRKVCRAAVYDTMHIHADLTQNLKGKIVAEAVSGGAETVLVDFDAITNEDELAATAVSDAQTAVNSATTARDDAQAAMTEQPLSDIVGVTTAAKTTWDDAVAATITASAADATVAAAKTDLDNGNTAVTDAVAAVDAANTALNDAVAALAQALVDAQAALDAAIDAAQEDVTAETTARDDAQAAKDAGATAEADAVTAAIQARDTAQAAVPALSQAYAAAQTNFLATTPSARNAEFNAHSAYNTAKAASDASMKEAQAAVDTAEASLTAAQGHLAKAQADKAEIDSRQSSRGADVPRRVNLTMGEDHYLKLKDNTDYTYGEITDVKVIFQMVPIRDRTAETSKVSKLSEMSTFYSGMGSTKSQQVRFAVKPKSGAFRHPSLHNVTGYDEVQSHMGYCPSNLVLTYSDGTNQAINFGGSDSRRYHREDSAAGFAFEKTVYVKPMLDFTISATPNFPTDSADFTWHAAMNFDAVTVDVFQGSNVKALQKDVSVAQGYCPAIDFDETAYDVHKATQGLSELPAIVEPAGPDLTGELTVSNSAYDNTTRTLTFDVTSTLAKELTTHVSVYSYGDEERSMIQKGLSNYYGLEPNPRTESGTGSALSEQQEPVRYWEDIEVARVSTIPGAFTLGPRIVLPSGHVQMGIMKAGEQKYIEMAIELTNNGDVSEAIVVPVGTSSHSIDLSGMPAYDLDLVAVIDGRFQYGNGNDLDLDHIIGAGGMIKENINDNLVFFTDGDDTKLEHNGTVYPNEPYYNPVILDNQLSPFGVSAIVGNNSLDPGRSSISTGYNDVYECTTDQVNLIQSWGHNSSTSIMPNTPGQISGTYDSQTYYLHHRVPFENNKDKVPSMMHIDPHGKRDTLVVPFADLTPGKVYCHVVYYGVYGNRSEGVFKGDPRSDPLGLPKERMFFFKCPNPADGAGADNLKIKIAMTNQAPGETHTSQPWKVGKKASAENAFNAMCKLFPTVIYLEAESTYDAATGDAVIAFNCPGANQSILTDGQAYKGTSAWTGTVKSKVDDKMQGTWTVDQKVIADMAEPAPTHILRCYVSGDHETTVSSYVDQSDPDAIWQKTGSNARRLQTALTLCNEQGFKNIRVRKSARDQNTNTRKLFIEQYDIALYSPDQATVDALVGTNLLTDAFKLALSSYTNFSNLGNTEVLVDSVVAYQEAELPAIYNVAGADMFRWSIEFTTGLDITAADISSPQTRYNKTDLYLIQKLNKIDLVDISFGNGVNWENANGKFETYMECSATEAAMQNAVNTFYYENTSLTSTFFRITKATNLTEKKRYKFELATGSWVNSKMWDNSVGSSVMPVFDPNFLRKDHPVWGLAGMSDIFKAGFKRLGFSNIILNAGSNGPANTPLYKFTAEFDSTPGAVASALSQKIYFGNDDANAKMSASFTQYMRIKYFEIGEFTITEVADAANLPAASAAELVMPPLNNAILGTFTHADGNIVTIQGALLKTDGVLAEEQDTNALACYGSALPVSNTTGITTVYVDPYRNQSVDMGSVSGFSVAGDGQVLVNGNPVYVVIGDTTGANAKTDLTGTAGSLFGVINTLGKLIDLDIREIMITVTTDYDGWSYVKPEWGWLNAPEHIIGVKPSLVMKNSDGQTVFSASADDLLAIPNKTRTFTVAVLHGDYTIQGICNYFPGDNRFSVSSNGQVLVPPTRPNPIDQEAADWMAEDPWSYANEGPSVPIAFATVDKALYTLSAWDNLYPGNSFWIQYRAAWEAGSVIRLLDSNGNIAYQVPGDWVGFTGPNENQLAGTYQLSFEVVPGDYTLTVGANTIYYYDLAVAIWSGATAVFGDAEDPVGAHAFVMVAEELPNTGTAQITLPAPN